MDENEPTNAWTCSCGHKMARYRGQSDQDCPGCGQWFNACGQRLRNDWMNNASTYDEGIGDLEGWEMTLVDDV